jgi:nucleotide-binding universal stress UspA family protein
MINVRTILYATDFSPCSNQAYFHAVALAENHAARLIIVHVYSPASVALPGARPDEHAHLRGQLEQIRQLNPGIPVQHILLDGDAAEQIIRCAAETQADLIVMGTHGHTGQERLLMGSAAAKVMRGAPCSVLIVKMPRAAPTADKCNATEVLSPA